jgi:transcriptional regulator with GAF, ATPase, and Fis domain
MTEAPNDPAGDPQQIIAELQRKLDERTAELDESIAQQTATSEVLKVISRSTFGLSNVLDTLVSSASRLCGTMSTIYLLRDGLLHLEAGHNISAEWIAYRRSHPMVPSRETPSGRAALTGQIDHVPDLLVDPEFKHAFLVKLGDYRATLNVPLVRDGVTVGVLSLGRPTPGPFTPRQIELAKTFADQAVIAIENTRLFDEVQAKTRYLSESLQQQTATAEVLKTISRSTFDLQTVLRTLVESAARLCDADKATITRQKGSQFYRAESFGFSNEFMDYVRSVPIMPDRGSATGRALLEGVMIFSRRRSRHRLQLL